MEQDSEPNDLSELFLECYEDLKGFFARCLGSGAYAVDAVHDMYERISRTQTLFKNIRHKRAYLYKAAARYANALIENRRRQFPGVEMCAADLDDAIDEISSPERIAIAEERLELVTRIFENRLTEMQQQAVLLKVSDGLSYAEIAMRLNTTSNAVEQLLAEAIKRLRGHPKIRDDR